jgi:hypothetical protein
MSRRGTNFGIEWVMLVGVAGSRGVGCVGPARRAAVCIEFVVFDEFDANRFGDGGRVASNSP